MMTSMTSDQVQSALDALTADSRRIHSACVRLLAQRNPDLAGEVRRTHSRFVDLTGTTNDPAHLSYSVLLERLGPIAEMMPQIAAATIPRSALWAATGQLGNHWIVAVPVGVVSFFRKFCTIVFSARDAYKEEPELETSIAQMSRLLGEHLEFGSLDFVGTDLLPQKSKPLIEHLTQLAYEFFILHEACHARECHKEPSRRETTWYQEAHLRHANEFAADRWAFITLLASFSNDMHFVAAAIALLFDSLDLLDRFDFAPMSRLTHPSPATRKWRIMQLLKAPESPEFLDQAALARACEFSLLYERLTAFIVDRAKPETPLNDALNRGVESGAQGFIEAMLPILATGDPSQIIRNLASVRASTGAWAVKGTADDAFASRVDECIDSLAHKLGTVPHLNNLARTLMEAGEHFEAVGPQLDPQYSAATVGS
jgi:hypothetical protein